jgi:hypothetical protein
LEILRFVARVGLARPEDLITRFDFSIATAYRRLGILKELDLLHAVPNISFSGNAYIATRTGIATAELPLPVAEPKHSKSLHDFAMTEVVSWMESVGIDVLTERELTAHKRISNSGRYSFSIARRAGRFADTHKPDIICEVPEEDLFVAIEVELQPKSNERWRDILYGFQNRVGVDGFAGVLYLTGPGADVARLRRAAEWSSLGARFQQLDIAAPDYLPSLLEILAVPEPPLFRSAA